MQNAEFCDDQNGKNDKNIERNDPLHSPKVEQSRRWSILGGQNGTHQKTGNHKENVDSQIAGRKVVGTDVKEQHSRDGDSAKALDFVDFGMIR